MSYEETLKEYFPDIEALIREEYERGGWPEASFRSALRVNTEQLAGRARRIMEHLPEGFAPEAVCELGCGYGFLALALALLTGARVTAADRNVNFLNVGRRLLERRPELKDRLLFVQADYAEEAVGEDSYDLVTLNNTFCYVTDPEARKRAARNIHRCLREGGWAYFYQFNKLFPREPFTRLWGVHWLPHRLGDAVSLRMGRRTLKDLQYLSPAGHRRLLEGAGFGSPLCAAIRRGRYGLPVPMAYYTLAMRKEAVS